MIAIQVVVEWLFRQFQDISLGSPETIISLQNITYCMIRKQEKLLAETLTGQVIYYVKRKPIGENYTKI